MVCVIGQAHQDLKDPQENEASMGCLASQGPLDFQDHKEKLARLVRWIFYIYRVCDTGRIKVVSKAITKTAIILKSEFLSLIPVCFITLKVQAKISLHSKTMIFTLS